MNYVTFISRCCAALAVFVSTNALAQAPERWECDAAAWQDGTCDCGCGAVDVDCPEDTTFVACETSACPSGQVPWEHSPESCMSSTCGDGWVDTERGEACDDFEALAGGGCNADCSAVNDGYTCGAGAAGCVGPPSGDDTGLNTGAEQGEQTATDDESGCTASPSTTAHGVLTIWVAAAVCVVSRIRRSTRVAHRGSAAVRKRSNE
jgi:cysteine-rich repeat protein